jgi:hypothetical protein
MKMFRTLNLHTFFVTWYLNPEQFPSPFNNEEFLADRFIEDVMEGRNSVSLVIQEVKIPEMMDRVVGQDVGVVLKILATEPQARSLIDLGYKVRPEHPDKMDTVWDDEPEGMTWGDFTSILRGTLPQSDKEAWTKEVRATDDNDPNSPWFRVMGIKHDDDGIFLAIEEIEV